MENDVIYLEKQEPGFSEELFDSIWNEVLTEFFKEKEKINQKNNGYRYHNYTSNLNKLFYELQQEIMFEKKVLGSSKVISKDKLHKIRIIDKKIRLFYYLIGIDKLNEFQKKERSFIDYDHLKKIWNYEKHFYDCNNEYLQKIENLLNSEKYLNIEKERREQREKEQKEQEQKEQEQKEKEQKEKEQREKEQKEKEKREKEQKEREKEKEEIPIAEVISRKKRFIFF